MAVAISTQKTVPLLLTTSLLWVGCANGRIGRPVPKSDGAEVVGAEGAHCFPNKTCFAGLACLSNRCVKLPDAGKPDTGITDGWKDTGVVNGFGQRCSSSTACKPGLICAVVKSGSTAGSCSKYCPKAGFPCVGGPAGTQAYCLVNDGKGKLLCLFLCKFTDANNQTHSYPCPSTLKCSPVQSGSSPISACMD